MSTGLFGIGTSALLASQRALSVTSNNIANVNTEGYSRQSVQFVEREPSLVAGGFVGKGVDATAARRAFDQFTSDRLTAAITSTAQQETIRDLGDEIDRLLADERAGLQASLDRFYDTLGDFATDPADTSVRGAVLTEAASLEQSIVSLNTRLDELRRRSNGEISNLVSDINQRTESLAALNAEIIGSGRAASNQLLDERDRQVRELSELIGVSSIARGDGTLDLFVGNGQPLVVGAISQELTVSTPTGDPLDLDVGIAVAGGTSVSLAGRLGGGRLAGLVDFQDRILNPAQNALGRVAIATAETFNQQNRLGIDLNGEAGDDIFRSLTAVTPRAFFAQENTGDGRVAVQISDVSDLTISDYTLRYEGLTIDSDVDGTPDTGTYTLTRTRDGAQFVLRAETDGSATGALKLDTGELDTDGDPILVDVDGLSLNVSVATVGTPPVPGALPAAGDTFFIQPTRSGAGAFRAEMSDPVKLAAASPLRTVAVLDNSGSAQIDRAQISAPVGSFEALTLTFSDIAVDSDSDGTGDSPGFLLSDADGLPITDGATPPNQLAIPYDPATESDGRTFTEADYAGFAGFEFSIRGVPDAGDEFTIEPNDGAFGDNSNALALEALRFEPVFAGNTSISRAFGELVSEVGTRTRQAGIAAEAGNVRLDAARTAYSSISGVNLEEEATNLLQQQRSFEAAARIIAVANETFQTLLDSVR